MSERDIHIEVEGLELAYDDFVIQRDLNFSVERGRIFVIMGDSGCGKTTLLRSMVGLLDPAAGKVKYDGHSYYDADERHRRDLIRKWGILYQSGALWSSMTLGMNVALPLEEFTDLSSIEISRLVRLKLELVGLGGYADYFPSQISGGMRKRAALARAMALDPDILFFDEPSAGLDPLNARRLDDLIIQLRDNLGATVVVVTHELASIFAIADDAIFLDAARRTIIARGSPWEMMNTDCDPKVKSFLTRANYDNSTDLDNTVEI